MLTAEVVAELNERAADAAARRLETRFATAGKVSADQFEKAFEAEVTKSNLGADAIGRAFNDRMARHGRGAGDSFGGAFGSQLAQSLPGVSGFASAMSGYDGAAGKVGAVAGRALGLAFTTAAAGIIGAAGYTLFKGFERYEAIDAAKNRLENLNRTLQQTNRATIDVGAVMGTVQSVVEDTRFSLDQAFSISTRALSSPTGDLERFMTAVADTAQFTGESLDSVGEAFLKIANKGKVSMEELGNELRGLPQDWLARHFNVGGAELAKMITEGKVGFNDLLETVEANVSGFAKGSVDTISGQLEQVQTAVARLGANFLGALFGKPTDDANDLVEVLKTLRERIDDVNAWVTAHQDDIKRFFEQGVQAAQDVASAVGDVIGFLDRMHIGVGDVVKAFVAWKTISGVVSLTNALSGVNTMLGVTLPASAAKGAAGISSALATIAIPTWLGNQIANKIEPSLDPTPDPGTGNRSPFWAIERGFTAPGRIWDHIFGDGPAPAAPELPKIFGSAGGGTGTPGEGLFGGPGLFGSSTGAPAGSPILDPTGADGSGSGPRLPPAPVVPYADLPAIDPRLQMNATLFSAQTSVADAATRLAEKEARVNQLRSDNNATADDILNAENDAAKARREKQEADMRFVEAQQNAYEQQAKQLNKVSGAMSDFGAQLDSDFGISGGLASMADNLIRFVASLAAAPLVGQLSAISNAHGDEGSGLVGMLASTGALGPRFMPGYSGGGGGGSYIPGMSSGMPYGLPGGTDTGGYGSSGAVFPAWVHQLEQAFGVKASTYSGHQEGNRNEPGYAPNPGGQNRGIDWSGPVDAMQRFADYLSQIPGALEQVIWQNPNTGQTTEIAGGRPQPGYFSGDLGGHQDHVHTRQSMAIPTPGGVAAPMGADWLAMAQAESSGNWQANTGNGFYGGLQFLPSSWDAAGGPQYAPRADLASPQQQIAVAENLLAMQGPGAWPNTFVPAGGGGGTLPGVGMVPQGTGPGGGIPGLPAVNGVGGAAGQSLGGQPYPGQGGEGGIGLGGMALDGIMAATSGLDMMAPGAGAAAKIGIQLANRTAKYAGQVGGILTSGFLDTITPAGDNPKASIGNSWFGKLAGGVAGAAPALPNVAGGKPPGQMGQAGQQGQGGNTVNNNLTLNNNHATEDMAGNQAVRELGAMYSTPGSQ